MPTLFTGVIIIPIIIFVIIAITSYNPKGGGPSMVDPKKIDFGLIFLGFISSLIITSLLIVWGQNYNSITQSELKTEIKIIALNDSPSFIKTSMNNGEKYYHYMSVTHIGAKMNKINANNAYIKEIGHGKQPMLEIYTSKHDSKFKLWLFGNVVKPKDILVFTVPEGTITHEFNVDMK